MTARQALLWGSQQLKNSEIETYRLDAEILLCQTIKNRCETNINRAWLYAYPEYRLAKSQVKAYKQFIRRRSRYEPIAYITHSKEFFGLSLYVSPSVMIPRPETETLVEKAIGELNNLSEEQINNLIIVDLATGSGCIGISLAKFILQKFPTSHSRDNPRDDPRDEPAYRAGRLGAGHGTRLKTSPKIYATDISSRALAIAQKNAKNLKVAELISFRQGNLLKALPRNLKIDLLLANFPYVEENYYEKILKTNCRAELAALKYEPRLALWAENNGLEFFEKLFKGLPFYLKNKAKILLEIDRRKAKKIRRLAIKSLKGARIKIENDLAGYPRVIKIEMI